MNYGVRYNPNAPYQHGGLTARTTTGGVPAPGMPVTTVTGRTKAVSPGPVYHGFGPLPLGAVTYTIPKNEHAAFYDPTIGLPPPTMGMPAPGFPSGVNIIGDPYAEPLIDPATGKVKWWVWGIVAAILLYVVKKYIV